MNNISNSILRRKPAVWAIALCVSLCASCSTSPQTKEQASEVGLSRADSLLGTWYLADMTAGVQFSTTFMPQGQLVQHFLSLNDGRSKDRIGTWELLGDTLVIRDAQGPDSLRIVDLTAERLDLMRSDSIPLFFERKEQSPEPATQR